MRIQTVAGLQVRVVDSPATHRNHADKTAAGAGAPGPLVCVLLHGFGASGDDLVGLAGSISRPDRSIAFVFPEGPLALRDVQPLYGDARAWWMIDLAAMERAIATGVARDLSQGVPDGMADARTSVIALLDALAADRSIVPEGAKLVLGGFSQGAMLALDIALRDPRPLAGLVLLSGTMVAEREWAPRMAGRRGLRVFQSHGTEDALLSYASAERLRDALVDAGLDMTFDRFVGPHTIPAPTLARLAGWLANAD